jgi:hypothetical protein
MKKEVNMPPTKESFFISVFLGAREMPQPLFKHLRQIVDSDGVEGTYIVLFSYISHLCRDLSNNLIAAVPTGSMWGANNNLIQL